MVKIYHSHCGFKEKDELVQLLVHLLLGLVYQIFFCLLRDCLSNLIYLS